MYLRTILYRYARAVITLSLCRDANDNDSNDENANIYHPWALLYIRVYIRVV